MTPDQFRNALRRLGLTQTAFSLLTRIPLRTVQRYARDGAPAPVPYLINLLAKEKLDPDS